MRFVPADGKHVRWITDRIHLIPVADAKGIAAESDDGTILSVCMMDTWLENSVQVHIAIDNPICLKGYTYIREVFTYIFDTAKRGIAIGTVSSDNEKALRFDKKIGFREVARIRDGHRKGVDIVLLELRREYCKWIKSKQEAA